MTHPASEAALPKGWPRFVKSALLHVIALAGVALTEVRARRRTAELERLQTELGLVQQQLRLVCARLARVPPRHRPDFSPTERLEILELRAARGWSVDQTAEALITTPETIATWVRRIDEQGPQALAQLREPVNKFPDFVALVVQRLKGLYPAMGKVKIAQSLARAGLHLAPRTVRRMLQRASGPPVPSLSRPQPLRRARSAPVLPSSLATRTTSGPSTTRSCRHGLASGYLGAPFRWPSVGLSATGSRLYWTTSRVV